MLHVSKKEDAFLKASGLRDVLQKGTWAIGMKRRKQRLNKEKKSGEYFPRVRGGLSYSTVPQKITRRRKIRKRESAYTSGWDR